jgi:polyisoprenoid-binding protein YceI
MPRLPIMTLFAAVFLGHHAWAATVPYTLDRAASSVAFETDFGPDVITGTIPLNSADLSLDFDRVANCTVNVDLDVSGAQASFPFAAQALKGPKVLDAKNHPRMTFESTSVKAAGDGAAVSGNLTIRGVTRPVTLHAEIYRQKGTEAGDRSRLTVRLTGKVNRSDFGAAGWADMVDDEVRIIITARIAAKD